MKDKQLYTFRPAGGRHGGGSHIDCCLAMLHTCILKLEKQEKDNETIFSILRKKTTKKTQNLLQWDFFS